MNISAAEVLVSDQGIGGGGRLWARTLRAGDSKGVRSLELLDGDWLDVVEWSGERYQIAPAAIVRVWPVQRSSSS